MYSSLSFLSCVYRHYYRASGVVHIARDNMTDEVVAVKLVNTNRQPQLGCIVKEIEALSMLKHQNIVNYKASYLCNKTLWIVMEYLDGQ